MNASTSAPAACTQYVSSVMPISSAGMDASSTSIIRRPSGMRSHSKLWLWYMSRLPAARRRSAGRVKSSANRSTHAALR